MQTRPSGRGDALGRIHVFESEDLLISEASAGADAKDPRSLRMGCYRICVRKLCLTVIGADCDWRWDPPRHLCSSKESSADANNVSSLPTGPRIKMDCHAREYNLSCGRPLRARRARTGAPTFRRMAENRFALDSTLEGDGFELSVPRERGDRFELSLLLMSLKPPAF